VQVYQFVRVLPVEFLPGEAQRGDPRAGVGTEVQVVADLRLGQVVTQ